MTMVFSNKGPFVQELRLGRLTQMKVTSLFCLCSALTLVAAACKKQQPPLAPCSVSSEKAIEPAGSTDSPNDTASASSMTSTVFQWPQFHGPRRDNISHETGLLKQWPSSGPKLLWTAEDIGEGFATIAVANGLIYTTGNIGAHTVITALDLDGKSEWTTKNGPAYKRSHPGTRSTPTVDNGRLYHQNADGDIICLDAATGKTVWSLNILEKFNGRNIRWGLAESLLVDGNNLICTPGGATAGIVALDKNTGQTVWICDDTNDKPGYCSPIVFEHKGVRHIVTMMARSIAGVNADNGKLLWQFEHITPYDENISIPIFHDGCIFVSTQATGSRLLSLKVRGEEVSVEQVWQSKLLDNQHGGVLLVGHYLYGSCRNTTRGSWACLDINTGKHMYSEPGIGRGSLTYVDGMLYALNHDRTVALVRPLPHTFEIISQFTIPAAGSGPTWAHPVVCNGRLYIRHGDFLYCYDIKSE
jgi:outer membrane protein assembly factor BamB